MYFGNKFKKIDSFVYRHIEYIGNGFPFVPDFQRFAVKTFPVTGLTFHINVGKKVHFYNAYATTSAGFAATAFHIKAKTAWFITANGGLGGFGEKRTNLTKNSGIGCGIGARGTSDRGLVDVDYLIDML